MSKLIKYAFLVKHASYSSNSQKVVLSTNEFDTTIIGVSDVKEAIAVAKKLVKKGIQLIELCGGFTKNEQNQIKDTINYVIPIGLVGLNKEDEQLLESNLK